MIIKTLLLFQINFLEKFEVDQQWCQDPFHEPTKGIIEPLTCPMVDGLSAQYCRKIIQEGESRNV